MTTIKAAFGGRVPLVYLDKGTSIPLGFVLQLPHQLTPTHITNRFGKAMVLDHILDRETLNTYNLVLTYDLSRELVLIVPPPISNTSVYLGDLLAGFGTVLTAFLLL